MEAGRYQSCLRIAGQLLRGGLWYTPHQIGMALWSSMKIRSLLYWLARLLGDVNAVRRGRVGQRIVRRVAGKAAGRAMRKTLR